VGRFAREQFYRDLPASIHVTAYAPYSELLPKAAATVHQGGIGTTAQALRAGRPMLIVPWAHDQPDNAERARKLGLARVIPRSRYSRNRAARELKLLLDAKDYRVRAAQLAKKIASEDGVATACDAVEAVLGKNRVTAVFR
jgi:UDP:flavonoid glycosyltransferase YjiC (YdhE family)